MAVESTLHPSFPADIEAEILLRLPVKTLKRFQCACKSWYSLISSSQFQKDHFHRAQHNPPLLLTLQNEEIDDFTIHFSVYNDKEGTLVKKFAKTVAQPFLGRLGAFTLSCHGLVCISSRSSFPLTLICNPSTEELISLPPPKERPRSFGFGYATSTQEFKVVRILYGKEKNRCEVFTLGTNHWRKARTLTPYINYEGIAPFLHGSLHFLAHIYDNGVKDTDYIAVFDINTEEYKQGIPLPEYYFSLGDCKRSHILPVCDFTRLTKLGGSLCLTFNFRELGHWLELWLLKDYNNAEWVKGYHISLDLGYPHMSYGGFWTYPTDTMRDESILFNCSDAVGIWQMCYDPQVGTITWLKEKEWASTYYVESFFPLGSR